jgi:hypothetical protein
MRIEIALIKYGVFWATVLIAWMALGYFAYHYSRIAATAVALGWIVFLCFLFGRILPRFRK